MLLVVTYSTQARQTLRNICRHHEETVIRRFGRAALLAETQLGAFMTCRLRARFGEAVQIERTEPFNEFQKVPSSVREAANAYAERENPYLPYPAFATQHNYPSAEQMRHRDL